MYRFFSLIATILVIISLSCSTRWTIEQSRKLSDKTFHIQKNEIFTVKELVQPYFNNFNYKEVAEHISKKFNIDVKYDEIVAIKDVKNTERVGGDGPSYVQTKNNYKNRIELFLDVTIEYMPHRNGYVIETQLISKIYANDLLVDERDRYNPTPQVLRKGRFEQVNISEYEPYIAKEAKDAGYRVLRMYQE